MNFPENVNCWLYILNQNNNILRITLYLHNHGSTILLIFQRFNTFVLSVICIFIFLYNLYCSIETRGIFCFNILSELKSRVKLLGIKTGTFDGCIISITNLNKGNTFNCRNNRYITIGISIRW